MGKMYDSIMKGLQEALDDASNKEILKRNTIVVEPLKEFNPQMIKNLRKELGMSQKLFAGYLGVSQKTVEAWEAGKNKPSGVACRLLTILQKDTSLPEKFPFVKPALKQKIG